MDLADQIVDAWRINNRLNLYLLEAIDDATLEAPLAKGKKVGAQLAHIHNVRLMWLKPAAPDLLDGLAKLEEPYTKETLAAGLAASGEAIATLMQRACASGKVSGFKPHPAAYLGYLIAHEANHRGQIEVALRQAGNPLPDKIAYGLWEWGVR